MVEKKLLDECKTWIKKVPGIQAALKARYKLQKNAHQKQEIISLLKENQYVIFSLHEMLSNEVPLIRKMITEEVKEWLQLYGAIRVNQKTIKLIEAPVGSIVLKIPQAVIKIPNTYEKYLAQLNRKSRYLIRKTEHLGYEFRTFSWNEHLEDIYKINTSKETRQGEPMRGWYSEPVKPRYWSKEESRYLVNYGAFIDNRLRAYIFLLTYGNFAFPKHIIGHSEYLTDGIMNGLIAYVVQECIKNSQLMYFYYGRFIDGSSLDAFKKHTGFQKCAIILDLAGQQEMKEYAKKFTSLFWLF